MHTDTGDKDDGLRAIEIVDGNITISIKHLSIITTLLISSVLMILYVSTCSEYNK